jgi:hypothetical protein
MNSQLQKVAEMIRKTFHTKDQNDCFDGCILYLEENCIAIRAECMKSIEAKFESIDNKLKNISKGVVDIKKEIGLNGKSNR